MSAHEHEWERREVLTEHRGGFFLNRSLRFFAWVCKKCGETGYAA